MQYNISFDIASIIFLSLYFVFLQIRYDSSSESMNSFRRMVLGLLVSTIVDSLSATTLSFYTLVPGWINTLLFTLQFILIPLNGILMSEYISMFIGKKEMEYIGIKINRAIYLAYFFACIANVFTNYMFRINENGEMIFGELIYLNLLMPVYFFLYTLFRIFINRKVFERSQIITFLVALYFAGSGMFLQTFVFPKILLAYFNSSIAIFILLLAFEIPDYKKLITTAEKLKIQEGLLSGDILKKSEELGIMRESMHTAFWNLDLDEKGQFINGEWSPEFRIMLKRENDEEPDYMLWEKSLHEEDRERAMKAFGLGMTGEAPLDETVRLLDGEGNVKWYRTIGEVRRNNDGVVINYHGFIRDIDDEKQREIMSLEKDEALDKLRKSEESLNNALKEAQKANDDKIRFVSNMSANIIPSVNDIIGFSNLAKEKIESPDEVEAYLNKIQISGNDVLKLLSDIHELSRIRTGSMKLEEEKCNILELVNDISLKKASDVKGKQQVFVNQVENVDNPLVICDKKKLEAILLNCIDNAIKFTPEYGKISIKISQGETSGDKALFSFKILDTGIGMGREFLEHVFEPFEREEKAEASSLQGKGLGLYMTKRLCDLMGGSISAISETDCGATIIIQLPLKIAEKDQYK